MYNLVINFTLWMKTQRQTNGNAITIGGQKLMLDNILYGQGLDRLVHLMLTVPITIIPEKSLLWDPDPGPSSPSGT